MFSDRLVSVRCRNSARRLKALPKTDWPVIYRIGNWPVSDNRVKQVYVDRSRSGSGRHISANTYRSRSKIDLSQQQGSGKQLHVARAIGRLEDTMHQWTTLFLLGASAACAQEPRFDVGSIKALPSNPKANSGIQVHPTGIRMSGFPMGAVIRWAYGLHPYQQGFEISGPSWLEPGLGCVYYDVEGKTERPVTAAQLRFMLRTLLKEKLGLMLHRASKEMTVCILSTSKDGPKLHVSEEGEMRVSSEGGVLHFRGALLSRLDESVYMVVPYLILDETGLDGRFDFDLDYQRYMETYSMAGPGGRVDGTAAVNKALAPLGLRADLERRPVEILVIDHVEKTPAAN